MRSRDSSRKTRTGFVLMMASAIALTELLATTSVQATNILTENFDEPGGFFEGGTNNQPSDPLGDWQVINNSSPLGSSSWFNKPTFTTFPAQSGSNYAGVDAASGNNTATLSDWLLTPQITFNAGDQVSFYTRTVDSPSFPDRLQLYLSTSGASANVGSTATSTGDFSDLLVDINPTYKVTGAGSFPNSWTQFTITLPASGTGRLGFRYFVENGGPGGSNSDRIGIDTLSVTGSSPNQWAQSTGGSWADPANWSVAIPNAAGAKVGFLSSPTGLSAAGIINLNGNRTVGQITFNNTNSYTLASGTTGTLTIDDSTNASPSIAVTTGNHSITAPVVLANGLTVTAAPSSSLTIANNITGNGTLIAAGAGTLSIAPAGSIAVPLEIKGTVAFAANTATGILTRTIPSITIDSTGSLTVTDPGAGNHTNRSLLSTGALSFAGSTDHWQGKLDLSANDLLVHSADFTNLPNQLKAGFNAGVGYWNGTAGIVSTTAAADATHLTTLGYRAGGPAFDGVTTTATDLLVKYTYFGDADLNGLANGADYQQIDAGFGNHSTGWFNGDFNYDNTINGSDFALIDNTFNQLTATSAAPLSLIATPATTTVPEPSLCFLLTGSFSLLARRRNHD